MTRRLIAKKIWIDSSVFERIGAFGGDQISFDHDHVPPTWSVRCGRSNQYQTTSVSMAVLFATFGALSRFQAFTTQNDRLARGPDVTVRSTFRSHRLKNPSEVASADRARP